MVGETGSGKTRLVAELAARASRLDTSTFVIRAHQGETNLPFTVLTDLVMQILRRQPAIADSVPAHVALEIGRLVPGFAGAAAAPTEAVTSTAGLTRLFSAVASILVAASPADGRPGVFVIDDVHWADDATLSVLGYLINRLVELPVRLALTWAPENAGADRCAAGNRHGCRCPRRRRRCLRRPIRSGRDRHTACRIIDATRLRRAFSPRPGACPCSSWSTSALRRTALWRARPRASAICSKAVSMPCTRPRFRSCPPRQCSRAGSTPTWFARSVAEATLKRRMPSMRRSATGCSRRVRLVRKAGPSPTTSRSKPCDGWFSSGRRLRAVDCCTAELPMRYLAVTNETPRRPCLRLWSRTISSNRDGTPKLPTWWWRAAARSRALYAHEQAYSDLARALALGYSPADVWASTGDVLVALGRYTEAIGAYESAAGLAADAVVHCRRRTQARGSASPARRLDGGRRSSAGSARAVARRRDLSNRARWWRASARTVRCSLTGAAMSRPLASSPRAQLRWPSPSMTQWRLLRRSTSLAWWRRRPVISMPPKRACEAASSRPVHCPTLGWRSRR